MNDQANDGAAEKLKNKWAFDLLIKLTEHFVRFSAIANAGGVVATMTVLGATAKAGHIQNILALPLACFALGVAFTGFAQLAALFKLKDTLPSQKGPDFGFRWMPKAFGRIGDLALFGGLGWFVAGSAAGITIIALA